MSKQAEKNKLLIVDDNPDSLYTFKAILKAPDLEIFTVDSGEKALQSLLEHPDISLILLDIHMPDMDGFETAERIKAQKKFKEIPILFITAEYQSVEFARRGFELGAFDYITKPVNSYVLRSKVKIFLTLQSRKMELTRRISEQKRVEKTLRQSEERFRAVVETAKDAIITIDSRGKIVAWNRGAQTMFGYLTDEIYEQPLSVIMPTRYRDMHHNGFQQVASGAASKLVGKTIELAGLKKDSTEFPIELSMASWVSEEENFFTAIIRDITERKQTGQQLLEKENAIASSINAIAMADLAGNLTYVNYAFLQMWGYQEEAEVLGKPAVSFWNNPDQARVVVQALLQDGSWLGELVARHKNGTRFYTQLSASMILGADEKPTSMMASFINITEQKRAENALRDREEKLAEAQKVAKLGYYTFNVQTGFWTSSAELDHIFGIDADYQRDVGGWLQIIHPDHRGEMSSYLQETVLKQHQPFDKEYKIISRKNGQEKWVHGLGQLRFDENKNPAALFGTIQDITVRKQAEKKLRESRESLAKSQRAAKIGSYLWDLTKNSIVWSDEMYHIFGVEKDSYSPATEWFRQFVHPDDIAVLSPKIVEQALSNPLHELEYRIIAKSTGTVKTVHIWGETTFDKDGNPLRIFATLQDVTELKQAEKALRESEEKLRTLFDLLPVGVSILDDNRNIVHQNPALGKILALSEKEVAEKRYETRHYFRPDGSPMAPEEFPSIRARNEKRLVQNVEIGVRAESGRQIWTNVSALPVDFPDWKVVLVTSDITERKQLEEETVRQERLAAVGQLSAGIAHDFNNLLMTIMGNADLLQHHPDTSEKIKERLAEIVKQSERAAKLTRQILDFSRQTINDPQLLDLGIYLNETLKFIERTIPESIRIHFNFERGDHTINADPAQMQQIITNLAVNARDAMPNGGTLYFDLQRTTLAPNEAPPCPEMKAGQWVRLAVTDTGSGIDAQALPHIFEPFFTTKEVGQGTGLGLAQIYGIVKQHNGCISVDSRVGQGTTFALYFPAQAVQPAATAKTAVDTPKGQGQTLLLAEDDPVVLDVTRTMLEMLNYQVIIAKNGIEALALYRAHTRRVALVLTDAVMPGMDGVELAYALQNENPDTKVILMSGYARERQNSSKHSQNIVARLQKPLSINQLAKVIRNALD